MHTTQDRQSRTLGAVAIAGCAVMILILTAFHFIQPELDPLRRFGSEYAAGRLGWLMNVGFFGLAVSLASLAIAFGHSMQPPTRARGPGVLLGMSSLGILGSGVFNANLQGGRATWVGVVHDLSGFAAFLTMIPAMILLSRRKQLAEPFRGAWRVVRHCAWLVLILFLAMLFVFEPLQLVGLGQRLFLAAMFTWLLSAAYAIRSGAFSLPEVTRQEERS
jgi:Protein of unknown function (DUF998)